MNFWLSALGTTMAVGLQPDGHSAASAAQCDTAWFYAQRVMAEVGRRPLVFGFERFFFAQLPAETARWYRPQDGPAIAATAPPAALVQASTSENAVRLCPSFRKRLAARHVRFGEAAVQWAARRRPNGSYRAGIVTISLPAVSADGRQAVLGVSTVFAPLGGGASLVHLTRNEAGAWEVAGSIGLWVS
jgi:hypothetical protein